MAPIQSDENCSYPEQVLSFSDLSPGFVVFLLLLPSAALTLHCDDISDLSAPRNFYKTSMNQKFITESLLCLFEVGSVKFSVIEVPYREMLFGRWGNL